MKFDGYTLSNILQEYDYQIKKNNSKTVWLQVDDRMLELERLQHRLSDYDCWHDPNASGSSLGALMVNGVKVYLKTNNADVMRCENVALQTLDDRLKAAYQKTPEVTIVLDNGKEIKNPIGVFKTPGTPKSDFYLKNESGDELHISHKKGTKPGHFQQWSGMTENAISSNVYAQQFQTEMRRNYGELRNGDAIAMRIPDSREGEELKMMAVYGIDATTGQNGVNCVDCLIQGTPELQMIDDGKYRLTCTNDMVYSYPNIPSGSYEPVMSIIYKGDRNNLGIKGARAAIYPIGGRNFRLH